MAAEILQRDDIDVSAPGKQADIVATTGDPPADIPEAAVDFVTRAGRVYQHGSYGIMG